MITEGELLGLITAERYAEFDTNLQEYITGTHAGDSASVQRVLAFLEAALLGARTRRAHYSVALQETAAARTFLGPRENEPAAIEIFG